MDRGDVMSDEWERMKDIVTRHAYPALTFAACGQLCRALIAAGYGDTAKARAEMVEKCKAELQQIENVAGYCDSLGYQKNGERLRNSVNRIRALAQQKGPSDVEPYRDVDGTAVDGNGKPIMEPADPKELAEQTGYGWKGSSDGN